MTEDSAALVRQFCQAFSRRDTEEILGFFAEDAVYHNIPLPAVKGKPAIKTVLDMFLTPSHSVEFVILNMVASGGTVFTERVDKFAMGPRSIELPVAGVFEVANGKISAWRDYFDMATWTRQTSG